MDSIVVRERESEGGRVRSKTLALYKWKGVRGKKSSKPRGIYHWV